MKRNSAVRQEIEERPHPHGCESSGCDAHLFGSGSGGGARRARMLGH